MSDTSKAEALTEAQRIIDAFIADESAYELDLTPELGFGISLSELVKKGEELEKPSHGDNRMLSTEVTYRTSSFKTPWPGIILEERSWQGPGDQFNLHPEGCRLIRQRSERDTEGQAPRFQKLG